VAAGALAPARAKPTSSIDFFDLIQLQGSKVDDPDTVPDIIEFVLSPHFADRPLYPRQATFLKLMFLEEDLLTDFDYAVIEQWTTNGFRLPEAGPKPDEATIAYQGDWGIVPDVLQRIKLLKANGYRWFAIVLAVLGRRSGKGYIGGLAGAYVLWNFLQLYDPRDFFGIDRDKRLASQVFAGKKMQARDNQWRDIVNVILGAPCFEQYISQSLIEQLTVNTPSDLIKLSKDVRVATKMDQATFEVLPKESTTMAARGPASFMQFYDEMAHMVQTSGGADSAEKVYESATPSLDQFKLWSFIYSGSSPWTMTGKFYELVQQGLSVEADSLQPVFPEMLVLQLESWAIYEDWKLTGEDKPMVARPKIIKPLPYGQGEKEYPEIHFPRLKRAIQEYDDRMRKLERANPDTFAVERRSKWAAALDTYFPEQHVRRMFDPFQGEMLEMQQHGSPTITYVCHGDPGKTGSNFGFAIAHKVSLPGDPMPHVVFDVIRAWTPIDFDDGQMDYIAIEEDLGQYIDDFLPAQMTFDQWNSLGMIQRLAKHARRNFKVTQVFERTATAPINWRTAETMKTALSLNLVHAPFHELFELECLFLRKLKGDKVDHPDTGPVTTKDVYDAVSIVIQELIGAEVSAYLAEQFTDLPVVSGMPGTNSDAGLVDRDVAEQFSRFTAERQGRGRPNRAPTTGSFGRSRRR